MVIESSVQIKNGKLDYVSFGTGKKNCIVITGMTMTGLAGLAEPVAAMYQSFQEDYTVYLFDRVSPIPDHYQVNDMANDIYEAMDLLNLDRADVLGCSLGAMIGEALAILHPEKVHCLISNSTSCGPSDTIIDTMSTWADYCEKEDSKGLYRDFFHRAYTNPNEELLKLIENTGTKEQFHKFGTEAKAVMAFDIRNEFDKIKCPVLIIEGEDDRVLGTESAFELAEAIHCEIILYKDYAHTVYDDAPDVLEKGLAFYRKYPW